MQKLKNNLTQWFPVVILLLGGLFAAGRITNTQSNLVQEIKTKLDIEIYDSERGHWRREFDRLQQQLDRIEEKIDAFLGNYQDRAETDGISQP